MEGLSVHELSLELNAFGVRQTAIHSLKENGIDGESLLMLIDDFEEFSSVVEAPLARLKVKKFVKQRAGDIHTSITADDSKVGSNDSTCSTSNTHMDNSESGVDISGSFEGSSFQEDDAQSLTNESYPKRVRGSNDVADGPSSKKARQPNVQMKDKSSTSPTFDVNKFDLPSQFSTRVQKAIDNGTLADPENSHRAAFVRETVSFYEAILPTPTTVQYEAISRRMVDEYPCLKDARTSKYWHTFNKQLTQRFRNNRRRSNPVKCSKVLLPEVNVTAAEENTSLQDEEDEENMLALQTLMRGKNPPAQTVQGLLIATRASREKWLQTASISIKDILKKYTALRMSKWLMFEFAAKVGEDVMKTWRLNWLQMCTTVLPSIDGEITLDEEKQVLARVNKNIYHRKPSVLPITFVQATGDIDSHFTSDVMEPRVVVFEDSEGVVQMFLCAENESVMELPSNEVFDGVKHLMAAYYVYGVEYPRSCRPSLLFLQEYVLGIKNATQKPVRYTTYVNSLEL